MRFIEKNDLFLLDELVKKNFSSKYKDSVLGILWTVLNPLLMMALFTIIFSTVFGNKIDNFPVYFLSGWCVFGYFNASVSGSMNSLKGNKTILSRTPAPKYIFILAVIISELLNFIIMFILLICIMFITGATFYFTLLFSFIPIFSLLIMVTGLGLMFSVVCVYYTDIQYLWSVLSVMLMYSSAIFYPMSIIPEPYRHFMMLNPMFWVISQFRCFVYLGVFPQLNDIINLFLLSLIILVFGIMVFKKYEDVVIMKF